MSGSKTTTTNSVDPKLMALYQQNYQSAQNLANTPYAPYSGSGVAPLTPEQTQSEGILSGVATNPAYGSALTNAQNAVSGILSNIQNAPTLANTDLTPYLNPYEGDVINSTMAQLNQQQNQALTSNQENATLDKAFGGNRLGVEQALTNSQYGMVDASTLAQLNASNFSQAQQAAEYDLNRNLSLDQLGLSGANAEAGLGMDAFNLASGQGSLLDQVGSEQQQQNQNVDNWNYQQFLNQLNWPFLMQDTKNQALGMIPQNTTQSTTQTGGLLGGILGGLGDVAMGAGLLF